MKTKLYLTLIALLLVALLLPGCATPTETAAPPAVEEPAPAEQVVEEPPAQPTEVPAPVETAKLILATTTSTQDSGLLDVILPDFKEQFNVDVDVIAVGTGQALTLGQDGNADVLLVHARAKEDEFMADGHGVRREDVMYNDFVILGPEEDPAGIMGMKDAAKAMEKIAESESTFVSRGDDSGTHVKEQSIWAAAGIEPAGDWYLSTGLGMGDVITMTNEEQAYTLSDRATYLARTLTGLDLVIVTEGDPILFNPYGVLAVNPNKNPNIQNDLANQFIDWLISLPTQEMIAEYGVAEFGDSLFVPDSQPWRDAHAAEQAAGIALKITGLVDNEMAWTEGEVKAMETMDAESTNKDGETETYTGVSLNSLLELAGVKAEATTLVFVADDGYTAEITLAEVQACTDCIVSFRSQGGFSTVLPGFSGKVQVKGVVEIQVK
jgi:tungstate transport system substrate-binding protein